MAPAGALELSRSTRVRRPRPTPPREAGSLFGVVRTLLGMGSVLVAPRLRPRPQRPLVGAGEERERGF